MQDHKRIKSGLVPGSSLLCRRSKVELRELGLKRRKTASNAKAVIKARTRDIIAREL